VQNRRMSLRGTSHPTTALVFLLLGSLIRSAEENTSLDLNYSSEPIDGAVLDLTYPVQDMAGTASGTDQKQEAIGGGAQGLAGEVVDLKAAGADIKETASEIKISLQGEILFDFDKADLRPAAEPTLTQIAALIKRTGKATVSIEGHTDSKGSQSYNMKLSDRRAASVKSWLVEHGIAAASIRTQGLGSTKPIVPNKKPNGSDDPEGRQKNRRVEITIKK